jgi:hypothetical protein
MGLTSYTDPYILNIWNKISVRRLPPNNILQRANPFENSKNQAHNTPISPSIYDFLIVFQTSDIKSINP